MKSVITKKRRFEIFKRDNFTCQYCGRKPPEVELSIDHKIARSNGGTDENDNLITACMECNLGKGIDPLEKYTPSEKCIRLNLAVPEAFNTLRKKYNLSWRELLLAGLESKKNPPTPPPKQDSIVLEANLRSAIKSLSDMWDILKKKE